MKLLRKRKPPEINASSMADIAFLLLIFFLVATTLATQKGLGLQLPPKSTDIAPFNERNIFKILINYQNEVLVEGKPFVNNDNLRKEAKEFILNYGHDPRLSDSPDKAIFSIKTSRKTKYKTFITILDEVKGAYYEIYAEKAGISEKHYRKLMLSKPGERILYEKGKEGIPMNISIAEPDKISL